MKSNFLKQSILNSKLIIISLLTIFTFSSCDTDDTDVVSTETMENYYVKYVIKGNGTYGRFSDWTATIPGGKYTNNGYQTRSWEQTYGPVKKGFKCEVKIGKYIDRTPTIEIHVSKNQEPFALKISNTGLSATYTIN